MKRILVICGMGVATSTVANKIISDYLESKGMRVEIMQAKVNEITTYADSVNLIVLMAVGAKIPAEIDLPVIKGIPFLTGVGKTEALEEIYTYLQ